MTDIKPPQPMQWVAKISKDLENLPDTLAESARWSKRSIYRIQASVAGANDRNYKPQIVSLGPYHQGSIHLRAMEKHKRRALLHFLKRSGRPLQAYVDALAPVAQDLRDAYDQLEECGYDTAMFLELMIVDGCFVLEILRVAVAGYTRGSGPLADQPLPSAVVRDYGDNDPIFSNHGMLYNLPSLRRDMLKVENQLPMLLLEKLVAVQNDNSLKDRNDLTNLVLKFFQLNISPTYLHEFEHCLHMLDIYRKSLLLEEPRSKKKWKAQPAVPVQMGGVRDDIILSATELNEAEIRIEQSKSRSLMDITFRGGVLRLPLIVVDYAFESLYLNLIAFERLHFGAGKGNDLTSYISFMTNIIYSSRDVSLLHSRGIIRNALGSDKAAATPFHSLSKDITLDPESNLKQVHMQVSKYCREPWHKWRANLMRTYFTNPWAILSVAAAIVLFALTFVQTVYSVLGYVNPPA
ncbi:UPF0481 protein [Salvia divinorum]|uniref:UPF0481 protein n=1 Tax=Salvia divinorum TaxID=28513 RepID=A0ABD1IC29_SALDI